MALNRDDQLEFLRRSIEEITTFRSETNTSIINIQSKIIQIESEFLRMDQRTKGVETEIKVARNTEKDTKAALKREVKIINNKMFEAEKRFPDIVKQFTSPLDEKLLLAYSIVDELEQQVDDVEERVNNIEIANGGSKRVEDDSDSEEYDDEEVEEGKNDEENTNAEGNPDQPAEGSSGKPTSPLKPKRVKSKTKKSRENRK